MDFNRRRFLTIASAAVAAQFIPLATHGAAKEIVAAVPDRYALVAGAWRDALGAIPLHFLEIPYYHEDRMHPRGLFVQKADDAIELMLDLFPKNPSVEEVRASIIDYPTLGLMDEEELRSISETMLPLTTVRKLCQRGYFKGDDIGITKIIDRYGPIIRSAF